MIARPLGLGLPDSRPVRLPGPVRVPRLSAFPASPRFRPAPPASCKRGTRNSRLYRGSTPASSVSLAHRKEASRRAFDAHHSTLLNVSYARRPLCRQQVEAPELVLDRLDLEARNPASAAYRRTVSGRITVPVPAASSPTMPTGRQWSTLNPY